VLVDLHAFGMSEDELRCERVGASSSGWTCGSLRRDGDTSFASMTKTPVPDCHQSISSIDCRLGAMPTR
jgi:hypothetical protein